MSDEERWTRHQPQADTNRPDPEPLWMVSKGTASRRAELCDHGVNGVELRIYVNGEFLRADRYVTRELALLEADTIRDALLATGWTR
jgi:hypothetical protein